MVGLANAGGSFGVFDTFPRPQSPTPKQIQAVAGAGRQVRRVRTEALPKLKGGLRAPYRTLELPGANPLKDAHAALDTAVLAAYGFSAKKDLLAQLLDFLQLFPAQLKQIALKLRIKHVGFLLDVGEKVQMQVYRGSGKAD